MVSNEPNPMTMPTMDLDPRKHPYIHIVFSPNLELVVMVRRFVSDFYMKLFGDAEGTSRLALSTHELLENSVKSSVDGVTTLTIKILPEGGERIVVIRTRNRASKRDLEKVKVMFDEMRSYKDPEKYYIDLLRKSMTRSEGSGLGLGRILAEGLMKLDYSVESDELTVTAQTELAASTKED